MAEALKSMGVQELSAAAAAAVAEPPPADAKPVSKKAAAAAAAAKLRRSRDAVAGMDADEGSGAAAADMDLAGGDANRQAWADFCDTAVARAASGGPPLPPNAGSGAASAPSYADRLPALTKQLAKVLTTSLVAATVVVAAPIVPAPPREAVAMDGLEGEEEEEEEEVAEPLLPHQAIEEVSVSAAVRASELRSDITKGAKLRKRKALSDLLQVCVIEC